MHTSKTGGHGTRHDPSEAPSTGDVVFRPRSSPEVLHPQRSETNLGRVGPLPAAGAAGHFPGAARAASRAARACESSVASCAAPRYAACTASAAEARCVYARAAEARAATAAARAAEAASAEAGSDWYSRLC